MTQSFWNRGRLFESWDALLIRQLTNFTVNPDYDITLQNLSPLFVESFVFFFPSKHNLIFF